MRLLFVHSFLLAFGIACALSTGRYDHQPDDAVVVNSPNVAYDGLAPAQSVVQNSPPPASFAVQVATSDGNKGIADTPGGASRPGDLDGIFGLAHALPSGVGALVAVCAFVCLEFLLSYAVTGNSPLGFVSDATKSAR